MKNTDQRYDLPDHEFEVRFIRDRDQWSAVLKTSSEPENNSAGFGITPEEALSDLFNNRTKDDYQKDVHR